MAKFDGVWKFTIISMMGEQYATYTFKSEGNVLSGTAVDEGTGEVSTFDNGKIDGDSFHFNITMKLPFGIMPFEITGTMQPDGTLAGESAMPMGVSKFTAVRVE